jgi:phage shock protein PspC (stress-responsive transcriptional regulator)
MAKKYRYSLDRHDAKIAGVCSTLGERFGIDPTFVRLGFIAAAIFISWKLVLVAYAGLGIWLAVERKRQVDGSSGLSEFERMDQVSRRKPTVHAMRTELDENDRRMMAIDHHLAKQNDELAREIEALRRDK